MARLSPTSRRYLSTIKAAGMMILAEKLPREQHARLFPTSLRRETRDNDIPRLETFEESESFRSVCNLLIAIRKYEFSKAKQRDARATARGLSQSEGRRSVLRFSSAINSRRRDVRHYYSGKIRPCINYRSPRARRATSSRRQLEARKNAVTLASELKSKSSL